MLRKKSGLNADILNMTGTIENTVNQNRIEAGLQIISYCKKYLLLNNEMS